MISTRANANAAVREDRVVETGRYFGPGDPVRIRVVHREHRTSVTDDGAAIEKAGRPRGWREPARRIAAEVVVNISRHGVISLPVVPAGPSQAQVVERIADAAVAFYQELLELSA